MVLRLEGVKKSFRNNEELVQVLQGVSFELEASDTLALRGESGSCLLYTSPSPRDRTRSRMPSSA